MKILIITIFVFSSFNYIQAEHLDSRFEFSLTCDINPDSVPRKIVRKRFDPPVYPREAMSYGAESVVSVLYDTNNKGEVINERILWQVNTINELDSNDTRLDKYFSRHALRTIRSQTFKASKDNEEGILSTKDQNSIIYFMIQGDENTFNLGNKFNRTLKRVKDATNNINKIPKLIQDIEEHLNSNKLTDVQRGSFLYLKAHLVYTKQPNSEEIKPLLIEMKDLIDSSLPYGPNAFKSLAFGSLLLGQIYINEQKWEKAIVVLEEAIHFGKQGQSLSPRFFNAHLQLGIAHYSNGNWCGAAKSWARAKMMAASKYTNYAFPEALEVYVNYANGRLDS